MYMDIIFYTKNVNYLKLYSVLAEAFYLGFITFYACAPFIYHGLLWIIINIVCCTCKYYMILLDMGCSTCQMAWLSLEGCEDTEVR